MRVLQPSCVRISSQQLYSYDLCHAAAGDAAIYQWVEFLKEQSVLWQEAEDQGGAIGGSQEARAGGSDEGYSAAKELAELESIPEATGRKAGQRHASTSLARDRDEDEAQILAMAEKIISSDATVVSKSAFQAHVANVKQEKDVRVMMASLLRNSKIRNATHNIMAYRIFRPDKNTFLQDFDDDGETAAGGRLLQMLELADCRDVAVVVTRWYGGVLLGELLGFSMIHSYHAFHRPSIAHSMPTNLTGTLKERILCHL